MPDEDPARDSVEQRAELGFAGENPHGDLVPSEEPFQAANNTSQVDEHQLSAKKYCHTGNTTICMLIPPLIFSPRHSLSCRSRQHMSRSSSTTFTVLTFTFALRASCPFAMDHSQCLIKLRSSQTWNPSGVSRLSYTNMSTRLHWQDEHRRQRMITPHHLSLWTHKKVREV